MRTSIGPSSADAASRVHAGAGVGARSGWMIVPLFAGGGVAWGIAARGWMRLLSTDPEFSWSGTIVIVMIATLAWTGGGVAAASRNSSARIRVAGRVVGSVLCLVLGLGQGMLLLPTALFGGLSLARSRWSRSRRVLLGALAALPVLALVTIAWREPAYSLARRFELTIATPLLCLALCVPYAAAFGEVD